MAKTRNSKSGMSDTETIDAPRAAYPISASMLTREISYCRHWKGRGSVSRLSTQRKQLQQSRGGTNHAEAASWGSSPC